MLKRLPDGTPFGYAYSSAYDTTRTLAEGGHNVWSYDKQKAKVRAPGKRIRIPMMGFAKPRS